jgi:hypothetical protein
MRKLRVRKASEIEPDPIVASTHEEFVNEDASRIFVRMVRQAKSIVRRPQHYVVYTPGDLERLPPCPGVYIAFSEGGRCFYVGESVCVGSRIGPFGSRDELGFAKYIAFIPCDTERDRRACEFYWMGLLDPVCNKQLRQQSKSCPRVHWAGVFWDKRKRLWGALWNDSLFFNRSGKEFFIEGHANEH